jgi:hypothetical protein
MLLLIGEIEVGYTGFYVVLGKSTDVLHFLYPPPREITTRVFAPQCVAIQQLVLSAAPPSGSKDP